MTLGASSYDKSKSHVFHLFQLVYLTHFVSELRRTETEEVEKLRVSTKTLERLKYEFGTVVPKV